MGGNAKRPRLEGPSGPLARLPTKNTSSFILLNGSSAPDPRDADDSDGGGPGGGYGGGGGGARRRQLSSGLPPLKVTPVGGIFAAPGSPDHHPPSSHRPHLLGHHHHHHGHGGGQHGMSLLGSSPRGVKVPQHRMPGGTFGTLMEDFEPESHEGTLGGADLAKAVQRTHGIGKASAASSVLSCVGNALAQRARQYTARGCGSRAGACGRIVKECSVRCLNNDSLLQVHSGVTFVQTEPDEDWRPPAAVCISTEHEWRLAGRAFKEQVGGRVRQSRRATSEYTRKDCAEGRRQ